MNKVKVKTSDVKQNVFALLFVFLTLVFSSSLYAQTLLWQEEFNGTAVDTSKWAILNEADGSDCQYLPKNVTVSG
jgi:hypothetical protein